METIRGILQPYSKILEQMATILSCLKLLRTMKILFQMKTRHYSDTFCITSVWSGLILATLSMRIDQLNDDVVMMEIHTINLVLNMGVVVICYIYATPGYRCSMRRKILSTLLVIALCVWYSLIEKPGIVKMHFNIAMTGITSLLILEGLIQGTEAIVGSLISLVVATSKVLYAISVLNTFMLYQHLIVLSLNLLRVLCVSIDFRPFSLFYFHHFPIAVTVARQRSFQLKL